MTAAASASVAEEAPVIPAPGTVTPGRARRRRCQRAQERVSKLYRRKYPGSSSDTVGVVKAIVSCLLHGKLQEVTAAHILKRAWDQFGARSSNAAVYWALVRMERLHLLTWERCHVPRWRGIRRGEDRPPSYPRFRIWDDARPRCTPRPLQPRKELVDLVPPPRGGSVEGGALNPTPTVSTTASAECLSVESVPSTLAATLSRSPLAFAPELLEGLKRR